MMISAGPTLASRQSPVMMQHRSSSMAAYHAHPHYHHHSHNGMQDAYSYMSSQHYHPQPSPSLGSTHNMSLNIPRTAPSLPHHQHQQHHHHHHNNNASAIVPKTEPRDPMPLHPMLPNSPVEHNYEVGGQLSTNGFPTRQQFDQLLNDYILSLSPKKRDKALIPQKRYGNILAVLKEPKCTTIESAQFRFWVKKMFRLGTDVNTGEKIVLHEGKPVAVRETLYDVLTNSHSSAQHGGRDKTSAKVRDRYSWVPKELIARFVRNCPTCTLRRSNPVEFSASVSNSALSSRSQSFDASSPYASELPLPHSMDQKMPPSSMAPLPPLERSMSYTYPMDMGPPGYIMAPEHCHIDTRMYTTNNGRNSV